MTGAGAVLPALPSTFVPTRESLRALACYVVAPARKARTGRIGLRSVGGGFGTPPFEDGSRIVVRGNQLARDPGASTVIATLRAAAAFLDLELSADPGVGHDLPPYAPDDDLTVDVPASLALGSWYAFADQVVGSLADELSTGSVPELSFGTVSEAQLWPEHFDLAVTAELDSGATVNVGFSPGDGFNAEPYAYVGPHDTEGLSDAYWNAPFGAFRPYESLSGAGDPVEAAVAFVTEGLGRLGPGR